ISVSQTLLNSMGFSGGIAQPVNSPARTIESASLPSIGDWLTSVSKNRREKKWQCTSHTSISPNGVVLFIENSPIECLHSVRLILPAQRRLQLMSQKLHFLYPHSSM